MKPKPIANPNPTKPLTVLHPVSVLVRKKKPKGLRPKKTVRFNLMVKFSSSEETLPEAYLQMYKTGNSLGLDISREMELKSHSSLDVAGCSNISAENITTRSLTCLFAPTVHRNQLRLKQMMKALGASPGTFREQYMVGGLFSLQRSLPRKGILKNVQKFIENSPEYETNSSSDSNILRPPAQVSSWPLAHVSDSLINTHGRCNTAEFHHPGFSRTEFLWAQPVPVFQPLPSMRSSQRRDENHGNILFDDLTASVQRLQISAHSHGDLCRPVSDKTAVITRQPHLSLQGNHASFTNDYSQNNAKSQSSFSGQNDIENYDLSTDAPCCDMNNNAFEKPCSSQKNRSDHNCNNTQTAHCSTCRGASSSVDSKMLIPDSETRRLTATRCVLGGQHVDDHISPSTKFLHNNICSQTGTEHHNSVTLGGSISLKDISCTSSQSARKEEISRSKSERFVGKKAVPNTGLCNKNQIYKSYGDSPAVVCPFDCEQQNVVMSSCRADHSYASDENHRTSEEVVPHHKQNPAPPKQPLVGTSCSEQPPPDDVLYRCPILNCGILFTHQAPLLEHLAQTKHSPCNPVSTLINGTIPGTQGYLCPLCGCKFLDENACLEHMLKQNHARLMSPLPFCLFACPQCLFFFPSLSSTRQHMENLAHHSTAFSFEYDLKNPNGATPIPVPHRVSAELISRCLQVSYDVFCQDCQSHVSTPVELQDHVDRHHILVSKCAKSVRDVFITLITDQACAECHQFIYSGIPATELCVHTDCPLQGPVLTSRARTLKEFILRCGITDINVGTQDNYDLSVDLHSSVSETLTSAYAVDFSAVPVKSYSAWRASDPQQEKCVSWQFSLSSTISRCKIKPGIRCKSRISTSASSRRGTLSAPTSDYTAGPCQNKVELSDLITPPSSVFASQFKEAESGTTLNSSETSSKFEIISLKSNATSHIIDPFDEGTSKKLGTSLCLEDKGDHFKEGSYISISSSILTPSAASCSTVYSTTSSSSSSTPRSVSGHVNKALGSPKGKISAGTGETAATKFDHLPSSSCERAESLSSLESSPSCSSASTDSATSCESVINIADKNDEAPCGRVSDGIAESSERLESKVSNRYQCCIFERDSDVSIEEYSDIEHIEKKTTVPLLLDTTCNIRQESTIAVPLQFNNNDNRVQARRSPIINASFVLQGELKFQKKYPTSMLRDQVLSTDSSLYTIAPEMGNSMKPVSPVRKGCSQARLNELELIHRFDGGSPHAHIESQTTKLKITDVPSDLSKFEANVGRVGVLSVPDKITPGDRSISDLCSKRTFTVPTKGLKRGLQDICSTVESKRPKVHPIGSLSHGGGKSSCPVKDISSLYVIVKRPEGGSPKHKLLCASPEMIDHRKDSNSDTVRKPEMDKSCKSAIDREQPKKVCEKESSHYVVISQQPSLSTPVCKNKPEKLGKTTASKLDGLKSLDTCVLSSSCQPSALKTQSHTPASCTNKQQVFSLSEMYSVDSKDAKQGENLHDYAKTVEEAEMVIDSDMDEVDIVEIDELKDRFIIVNESLAHDKSCFIVEEENNTPCQQSESSDGDCLSIHAPDLDELTDREGVELTCSDFDDSCFIIATPVSKRTATLDSSCFIFDTPPEPSAQSSSGKAKKKHLNNEVQKCIAEVKDKTVATTPDRSYQLISPIGHPKQSSKNSTADSIILISEEDHFVATQRCRIDADMTPTESQLRQYISHMGMEKQLSLPAVKKFFARGHKSQSKSKYRGKYRSSQSRAVPLYKAKHNNQQYFSSKPDGSSALLTGSAARSFHKHTLKASQAVTVGQQTSQTHLPALSLPSLMLRLDGPTCSTPVSSNAQPHRFQSTTTVPKSAQFKKLISPHINHLATMKRIVFADLENFMLFRHMSGHWPPSSFLWGFISARPNSPFHSEEYFCKFTMYQVLKALSCVHISTDIGTSKDAVDFAMTLAIAKLDDRLPPTIPFFIVSRDKGFLEVENQMKESCRVVKVVSPTASNVLSYRDFLI